MFPASLYFQRIHNASRRWCFTTAGAVIIEQVTLLRLQPRILRMFLEYWDKQREYEVSKLREYRESELKRGERGVRGDGWSNDSDDFIIDVECM